MLWLALFTTAEAKRIVPGLWHGSMTSMAEAARMPIDVTVRALDSLLDHDMVEYDHKHRVLRLTKLPDAGEYPSSPTIVTSWWKRFRTVPACAVRDAHVATIRWILDQGALVAPKNRTGKPTAAHEEVWAETFATVQIPPPRRRGMRRLVDTVADTGTAVQPSLFGTAALPSGEGIQSPSELPSALPPGSDPEIKDLRDLDTLSRGYGEGEGVGAGAGVGDSFFSSSGTGAPDPGDPDLGAAVRGRTPSRPHLALVPPVGQTASRDPVRLLMLLGGERFAHVREGTSAALCTTNVELDQAGVVDADLAFLCTAVHGVPWSEIQQIPGDPRSRLSVWAAVPGNVIRSLADAREHVRVANAKSEALRENMLALGMLKETVH